VDHNNSANAVLTSSSSVQQQTQPSKVLPSQMFSNNSTNAAFILSSGLQRQTQLSQVSLSSQIVSEKQSSLIPKPIYSSTLHFLSKGFDFVGSAPPAKDNLMPNSFLHNLFPALSTSDISSSFSNCSSLYNSCSVLFPVLDPSVLYSSVSGLVVAFRELLGLLFLDASLDVSSDYIAVPHSFFSTSSLFSNPFYCPDSSAVFHSSVSYSIFCEIVAHLFSCTISLSLPSAVDYILQTFSTRLSGDSVAVVVGCVLCIQQAQLVLYRKLLLVSRKLVPGVPTVRIDRARLNLWSPTALQKVNTKDVASCSAPSKTIIAYILSSTIFTKSFYAL